MEVSSGDEEEWKLRERSLFRTHEPFQNQALTFSTKNGGLPMFTRDRDTPGARPGSKSFLAYSYQRFFSRMVSDKNADVSLCYYEMMMADRPSHLHVDAEWYFDSNPEVDRDSDAPAIAFDFVAFVAELLVRDGFVESESDVRVTMLDSTTKTKWSCHIVFWLRDGRRMFQNNFHCGAFVRRLLRKATESGDERFFFKPEDAEPEDPKTSFFADMAIYSSLRSFRICGSGKWNRVPFWPMVPVRVAVPLDECLVGTEEIAKIRQKFEVDWMTPEQFLLTLVQRCPDPRAPELVRCLEVSGAEPLGGQAIAERSEGFSTLALPRRTVDPADPYPASAADNAAIIESNELRAFVREASRCIEDDWGDPEMRGTVALQKYYADKSIVKLKSRGHVCAVKSASMGREGASHRGNHVYFVVDVPRGTYYQGCHSKRATCVVTDSENGTTTAGAISKDYQLSESAKESGRELMAKQEKTEAEKELLVECFVQRMEYIVRIPASERS